MATEPSGLVESASSAGTHSTLLTFLIADIRGYTRFTAEQGDEAAARFTSRFADIAETVVGNHGGEVVELRGDEALSVFHSARNAVRAAVALQTAYRDATEQDPSMPLTVGIGLDAGDAIPVKSGFRGGALNLAARLCSIAEAGEIFSSEAVIGLARKTEGIDFLDRGEVTLKGLDTPVRVFQIASQGELQEESLPLQPLLVAHPTNLTDEPTPFVGRDSEIGRIAGLLLDRHTRMVTLTGTGGTGKSRLALQVSATLLHDFRDGAFVVPLASLADPGLIVSAITEVLSIKSSPDKDPFEVLTQHLRDKQLLLLLDNYEHLLESASVLAGLLESCGQLRVLVTSRIPLHLSHEHEYAVLPLSIPDPKQSMDVESLSQCDSVMLFMEPATAVKADFQLTSDNASAVADICSRLDGLPLAIELAAARIKFLPPHALLQRLSNRLNLLTGGAKDRPARHQTLRAAIDWSFSALVSEEQAVFSRLSVFSGGCSFEAAEAVCNLEGELDLFEALASLVDKSLIRQEGERELRFSMLETIREYAGEKLIERGEDDGCRRAHADFFLQMATMAERELRGPRQREWLRSLDAEIGNVRAALRWLLERDQSELQLRLATALDHYWFVAGRWSEARQWLEAGLQRSDSIAPAVRAAGLRRLGELLWRQGDHARAALLEEEALALFRALGDSESTAGVLGYLGIIATEAGNNEKAAMFLHEAFQVAQNAGHNREIAFALFGLGLLGNVEGEFGEARQRFEDALTISRAIGDTRRIAHTLINLGVSLLQLDLLPEAKARLEEALALAQGMEAKLSVALALEGLGHLAARRGDHALAAERLRESLVRSSEVGSRALMLGTLGHLAAVAAATGQAEQALQLGGAEAALRESSGLSATPFQREDLQRALDNARSELSEEAWRRAWQQGRAMNLEEAIGYALGDGVTLSLR